MRRVRYEAYGLGLAEAIKTSWTEYEDPNGHLDKHVLLRLGDRQVPELASGEPGKERRGFAKSPGRMRVSAVLGLLVALLPVPVSTSAMSASPPPDGGHWLCESAQMYACEWEDAEEPPTCGELLGEEAEEFEKGIGWIELFFDCQPPALLACARGSDWECTMTKGRSGIFVLNALVTAPLWPDEGAPSLEMHLYGGEERRRFRWGIFVGGGVYVGHGECRLVSSKGWAEEPQALEEPLSAAQPPTAGE